MRRIRRGPLFPAGHKPDTVGWRGAERQRAGAVRSRGESPVSRGPCASGASRRENIVPRMGTVPVLGKGWSGRRDLNPRLQPWQGCTLPLSYARVESKVCETRRVPVKINLPGTWKSLAPTWIRGPHTRSLETGAFFPRQMEPHRPIHPPMSVSIEYALKPVQCTFNAHFALAVQFHIALGRYGR